jgi:hypothetical protein
MEMSWMFGFYSVAMVIFGLYAIGIGLLGLVRKRPFAFPSRQLMWILFLVFLPNLINSFIPLFSDWGRADTLLTVLPLFNLSIMVLLVFVFWRQMTGYMVFGVYDETFRDALSATLNKLKMPFQETISKIRLVELDADLQAAVTAWMGIAQIRIKQGKHAHYIKQIAAGMNEYYASTPVKVNNVSFIIYLILGILMLIMAGFIYTV